MTERNKERLRLQRVSDGALQVVECAPKDPAQTAAAHAAERANCRRCRFPIGRLPFHMVNGEYFHADCTRVF